MSITLNKLCRDAEEKYQLKLIAGKGGMNNTVRWVHMVEDREVPEFLHGHELIFTTGIGHLKDDLLIDFIRKLKSHNAAGVVINIGPYLTEVPDEVVEYCNKENFPIFTLPWQVYIIDITYDFCRRIIENEEFETSVVQAFRNLITNPSDSEKYLPTLEQQGYGKVTDYIVLVAEFYRKGKNVTESLERSNHIRLWNLFAKSKYYPSAMFVSSGRLIVIRQDTSKEQIAQIAQMTEKLFSESETSYVMGISTARRGYKKVPKLLDEASAALQHAIVKGINVSCYSDIGINQLLFGIGNEVILKDFYTATLKDILDYDRRYKTDYGRVLYEYLKCDGSINTVADKLEVHRNTVNSKIKAIKSIFDLELTGEKKTELMLAFMIKENIDKQNNNRR